jgi:AcrR family transcriptional regulator
MAPQERILSAAEVCFTRSGFAQTSMDDIANGAGMRAGNLYRYFPSKSALITHLVEQVYCEIEAAFPKDCSLEVFCEALEGVLRDLLGTTTQSRAALLVEIWAEAGRNDEVLALCWESEARISKTLREALKRSSSPPGEALNGADAIVSAVGSLVSGLLKRRVTEGSFANEKELAGTLRLIRMCTASCRASETQGAGL